MDSLIALMIFAAVGFAAAFSIIPLQSRRERQDRAKTAEDDWAESGFTLSRGDFEMCRVLSTPRWTVAEYIFEDESRHEFGRYTSLSRYRATITFGDRSATLYIQGSGLNRSSFAGKVGGILSNSIVIRTPDAVLAELIPSVANGQLIYEVRSPYCTLSVRTPRWRAFNRGTVFDGDQEVGQYRRAPGVSRKVLVALKRDQPLEAKLWICSLCLLK
jgi:hypothetical protein